MCYPNRPNSLIVEILGYDSELDLKIFARAGEKSKGKHLSLRKGPWAQMEKKK